jgi:hypothetical protein
VTDFLDEKRREITTRLTELKPLADEYIRLQAAASALADVRGTAANTSTSAPRRRGPGRPRGSGRATVTAPAKPKPKRRPGRPPAKRRAGRRKGSGTRAAEASSLVKGQPGITIPELADKMGIKQNYLYRVLPGLAQEGRVSKRGRGWYPKG